MRNRNSIQERKWFKILRITLIIIAIGFIVYYLEKNWNNLENHAFTIRYRWLTIAFIFAFLYYYAKAFLWVLLNKWAGNSFSPFLLMKGWIYGIFGKYIPGKVFYWISRTQFTAHNFSEAFAIITISAFEVLLDITSSYITMVLSIPFFIFSELRVPYLEVISTGAILSLIPLIRPESIFKIARKIGKRITRDPEFMKKTIKPKVFYKLLFLYFLNTVVTGGIGLFAFVNAFYTLNITHIFYIAFVLSFTSVLSILILPVPAGIGIRETAFILLLNKIIPEETALIISLSSRLWITFTEILVILLWILIDKAFTKLFRFKKR